MPTTHSKLGAAIHGPLPTQDQLLNLVDRSGQGLVPVETARLRRGVKHLMEQLTLAGAANRELSAALKVARSERNAALLELALAGPLAVRCSFCGADTGRKCRAVRGVEPPRTPHTARLHAAARARGEL
jgi:hypothetical protein